MKLKILLKLFVFLVLFSWGKLGAQVNIPNFEEVEKPITGGKDFPFMYEVAAAWGDFNNDGFLDLMLAGTTASGETTLLYKNNGDNTFDEIVHSFPNLKQASITCFDFNNDGNIDVFLAGWNGSERYSGLWENAGIEGDYVFQEVMQGSFVAVNHSGGNRSTRYVVSGDYDNDGWTDLFIQGQVGDDKNSRVSYLYRNFEGNHFELVEKPVKSLDGDTKPFIQLSGGSASWADFDNDGFLDLVSSGEAIDSDKYDDDYGYPGSYNGAIYRNNGDGTFAEPILFLGTEEGDVTWIDYNNDGKLDLTVTGVTWKDDWRWLGDVLIYDDDEFIHYPIDVTGLPIGKQAVSNDVGDVNNDGFEDLLYMHADSEDAIFLNNNGILDGSKMFEKYSLQYTEPNVSQRGGTANLVDFNNDGNLDAFLIGYGDVGDSHGRLMENKLSEEIESNRAPGVPTNLQQFGSDGVVIFSWDAPEDDNTPKEALKYNFYIKQGDQIRMTVPADVNTGQLMVNEVSSLVKKNKLYKVNNLYGDFTWGVQAVDQSKATSPFAVHGVTSVKEKLASSVNIHRSGQKITILSNDFLTGKVTVYTTSGSVVYTTSGNINGTRFSLNSGVYLVGIETPKGRIVEKVIL